MNVGILTLLTAMALLASDEERLPLVQRAQSDFARVAAAASPQLHDANVCIQSQAAVIPIATPDEAPVFQFRKGYCTLAVTTITGEVNGYLQAAWAFDQAIAAWPARNLALAKKRPPEPLPSVLPALASISRLKAGKGDVKGIAGAINARSCNEALTTTQACESILLAGREWLGWTALRSDNLIGAAREFPATSTAWTNWVAGKQAFEARRYADAAASYRRAVDAWEARGKGATLLMRLGPTLDVSAAYSELGGAQLLAGDTAGALATLNRALRNDAKNARALFLRARAQDAAGRTEAAIADYALAARNALAKTNESSSGEAHLYRGISFYRRREFVRAEDEFNNALSFEIDPTTRADAVAWRRLAAVAGGSCDVGRRYLEEAMPAASPYFPREEARATMASCATTSAAQRSR